MKIWFDNTVNRLNSENRGVYLGSFSGDDKIIAFASSGNMELSRYDLSHHFEDDILLIEKYDPKKTYTVVFYDGEQKYYYLKRFMVEETDKVVRVTGDNPDSKLIALTNTEDSEVNIIFGGKHKKRENERVNCDEFIAVKGIKARGKRLTTFEVDTINLVVNDSKSENVENNGEFNLNEEIKKEEGSEPVQLKLPFEKK
jgi:topoisomerase-4 subunit A